MSPAKRSPDLGPWGDVLADAASADANLGEYLHNKVNRTAMWLTLISAFGLVGVILIWIVNTPIVGIFASIGSATSLVGIIFGYFGVRKSILAGKLSSHILKDGSSVKLMRRYLLIYQIFQISCFGFLLGFTSRIIVLIV